MSLQYDLETPVNVSALSGITKAQFIEIINTLKPLANIGGVIVMSGAASAHPDVTNNARFIRYVWLDTQTAGAVVLKIYQGTYPSDTYADWTAMTIPTGSITAVMLANYAVSILNGSGAPKIAYKQDASADATKSNYILRLDAAGQYVEVASLSSMVAALTIQPNKIDISTASNQWVLQYDSSLGYAVWAALSVSSLISANTISYDKLLNITSATNGYILRADKTTGVWAAILPDDVTNDIFTIRTLRLNRLADTGAVIRDKLWFDGTNWARFTPYFGNPTAGVTAVPDAATGGMFDVAHGLGAIPRIAKAYIECNSADLNYAVGDQIDCATVSFLSTAPEIAFGCTVGANATSIFVVFRDGAAGSNYQIMDKTSAARSSIAVAKWNIKFYAEL